MDLTAILRDVRELVECESPSSDLAAVVRSADVGTTVTPTVSRAGATRNTVPAEASFAVDARARTVAEQERVEAAMRSLRPVLPGAVVTVTGGLNRPPLEASASAALFARAQLAAARLGLPPLTQAAVGGASDGNFTAGVGTPTFDGIGAAGGGAHADDEHVLLDELPRRTALVASLVAELLADATDDVPMSGAVRQ